MSEADGTSGDLPSTSSSPGSPVILQSALPELDSNITGSGVSPQLAAKGSLKLVINDLTNLHRKVTTSVHSFGRFNWRLACKTETSKRTNNVKHLSVYVDCNSEGDHSESSLWFCEALVEFRLIPSQLGESAPFVRQFQNKFAYNTNNWGFPAFYNWADLMASDSVFVKHDRLIVEATVQIQKFRGVRHSPNFDFLRPNPSCNQPAVVVIDNVKVFVSKDLLSLYSPVFQTMFNGEWLEKTQTEIVLDDLVLEEFLELLAVLYPSHKPVTAENVESLLELGDKFQISYVVDICETFLTRTDDIGLLTKLLWSDQYNLSQLQDVCIKSFKSAQDIKALRSVEEFKNLSNEAKAALLEKVLKLL